MLSLLAGPLVHLHAGVTRRVNGPHRCHPFEKTDPPQSRNARPMRFWRTRHDSNACLARALLLARPAPAIELAVLDADYRQRGSLQLFSSLNTASTRSLPQILLPALLGCSRKA